MNHPQIKLYMTYYEIGYAGMPFWAGMMSNDDPHSMINGMVSDVYGVPK